MGRSVPFEDYRYDGTYAMLKNETLKFCLRVHKKLYICFKQRNYTN